MRDDSKQPTAAGRIRVTAFVDWNAQLHKAGTLDGNPLSRAKRTLEKTVRAIGRFLARHATDRFYVVLRLYHGWHKGWEPSENFRATLKTVSDTDFSGLAQSANVVCSSDVQYGHTLLAALDERTHAQPPIHLPNTLRQQSRNLSATEKMVDTALAADLLEWARRSPTEWALVLSEDDDAVPPIFTAEAWIQPHGGRAFIMRASRPRAGFLKLDGLLVDMHA